MSRGILGFSSGFLRLGMVVSGVLYVYGMRTLGKLGWLARGGVRQPVPFWDGVGYETRPAAERTIVFVVALDRASGVGQNSFFGRRRGEGFGERSGRSWKRPLPCRTEAIFGGIRDPIYTWAAFWLSGLLLGSKGCGFFGSSPNGWPWRRWRRRRPRWRTIWRRG
jgi:hypothetical protein